MNNFEEIAKTIDSYRDQMIELQKKLTAVPAISPASGGKGEKAKGKVLVSALQEAGFTDIKVYKAPDEMAEGKFRPNITARLEGKNKDKTVWVLSHLDVVPPGEAKLWDSDPYTVKVEDGKLYGRGVEDNQQGMVASFFAAKALIDNKIEPENNIGLLFVADEETGNNYGLKYMMENHQDLFKKEDIIVVPDAGNEEGTMIEVAEKSIVWLKFVTKGKQCHASMPYKGINSFRAASYLIVKLNSLYETFDKQNEIFAPPISTFEPTKKEPNVPNINTIPGEDVFYLDCRVLPEYDLEKDILPKIKELAKEIEEEFKVEITIETPQIGQAAPPTPADAPVVNALKTAIKEVYKVDAEPMGIGGGTVAAYFRKAGYNAAVWSKLCEMAHQPNEYCLIDNLVGDAKVFAHLFLQEV